MHTAAKKMAASLRLIYVVVIISLCVEGGASNQKGSYLEGQSPFNPYISHEGLVFLGFDWLQLAIPKTTIRSYVEGHTNVW